MHLTLTKSYRKAGTHKMLRLAEEVSRFVRVVSRLPNQDWLIFMANSHQHKPSLQAKGKSCKQELRCCTFAPFAGYTALSKIIVLFAFNAFRGWSTLLVDYITYYHDYIRWTASDLSDDVRCECRKSDTKMHANMRLCICNLDNKYFWSKVYTQTLRVVLFVRCILRPKTPKDYIFNLPICVCIIV